MITRWPFNNPVVLASLRTHLLSQLIVHGFLSRPFHMPTTLTIKEYFKKLVSLTWRICMCGLLCSHCVLMLRIVHALLHFQAMTLLSSRGFERDSPARKIPTDCSLKLNICSFYLTVNKNQRTVLMLQRRDLLFFVRLNLVGLTQCAAAFAHDRCQRRLLGFHFTLKNVFLAF